jgi:mevalonate kinase
MTECSAPGKIILFGEHAVVYGQPAIAVPVTQVQATASVEDAPRGSGCTLHALDLGRTVRLADAAGDDPLAAAVVGVLTFLQASEPDVAISIRSTIPIAGGMGSGAAVSAAIIRALAAHLGHPLDNAAVSALVFEVEKLHHGTPSGIDNTVVVYAQPVYFVKGRPVETFRVAQPFHIAIGDTGIASPTRIAVGDVRAAWQADPNRYNALFEQIGSISQKARQAIETGHVDTLGEIMNENHKLLQELDVSCPELDALVNAARRAGASGAKLSGSGRGGNMMALVTPNTQIHVERALRQAGAKNVIVTEITKDTGSQ